MKNLILLSFLFSLVIVSCNKEKRYSKKLIKGEVWSVRDVNIDGQAIEIYGDWEVVQDVSIYDSVPTVKWVYANGNAVFEWQFQNKGKNFQLNYHILCEELKEDELDSLDYLVYDLTGLYKVERHGRNRMIFTSNTTIKYAAKEVEIIITRKKK